MVIAHRFNIDMDKEIFGFNMDMSTEDARKILEERRKYNEGIRNNSKGKDSRDSEGISK